MHPGRPRKHAHPLSVTFSPSRDSNPPAPAPALADRVAPRRVGARVQKRPLVPVTAQAPREAAATSPLQLRVLPILPATISSSSTIWTALTGWPTSRTTISMVTLRIPSPLRRWTSRSKGSKYNSRRLLPKHTSRNRLAQPWEHETAYSPLPSPSRQPHKVNMSSANVRPVSVPLQYLPHLLTHTYPYLVFGIVIDALYPPQLVRGAAKAYDYWIGTLFQDRTCKPSLSSLPLITLPSF